MKTKKKLVYVSGPLTNGGKRSKIGQVICLFRAIRTGIRLMSKGYDIVIPHLTLLVDFVSPRNKITYNDWLEQSINILERCDAICMMENWETSKGARKEYVKAKYLNLEILRDY